MLGIGYQTVPYKQHIMSSKYDICSLESVEMMNKFNETSAETPLASTTHRENFCKKAT